MEHSFNVQFAQKYGIEEAIIAHNFYFWIIKNASNKKHFYNGSVWTYNSNSAFAELFPYINKTKINRAINHLESEGVIIKDNFNSYARDRTLWYAFSEMGVEFLRECGYDVTFFKMTKCIFQNELCIVQNEPTIPYNKQHIDIKEKEDNKLSSKKKFTPPSIEEVVEYVKEKGYHFDAESFFVFYESKGWMVGKNKMTKWKMACATWEKSCNKGTSLFNNAEEHNQNQANDNIIIDGQIYR